MSRTACFTLVCIVALGILPRISLSQTPEERVEKFLSGLTDLKDEATGDYWFSVTVGKAPLGCGRITIEKTTHGDKPAYKAVLLSTLQSARGSVKLTETVVTDAAFKPLAGKWELEGKMHGFGDMKESCQMEFAWTPEGLSVKKKKEGSESSDLIHCGARTVAHPRMFAPLLAIRGEGNYIFAVVDMEEDNVKYDDGFVVSVKAPAKKDIGGKTLDVVEVVLEKESMFFTPEGKFLQRSEGPATLVAVPSEAEAKKGVPPFDPAGKTDWTAQDSPRNLWLALSYSILKKDQVTVEKLFDWKGIVKKFLEMQGMPADDATLNQMLPMIKPQIIQSFLQGGSGMKPYHLLLSEHAVKIESKGEDEAVLEIPGQGMKFFAKKYEAGWKIYGLSQ
jgi:hypothetical protein